MNMDTQFLSAKKKTRMILKNLNPENPEELRYFRNMLLEDYLNLLCLDEKPKIREKMERLKRV
jgi:hypothetical protein